MKISKMLCKAITILEMDEGLLKQKKLIEYNLLLKASLKIQDQLADIAKRRHDNKFSMISFELPTFSLTF